MPFVKEKDIDFYLDKNNQIRLSKKYFDNNLNKFKKITGSRLASVIGQNKYVSEAKVWAMMTNIYFEPMDEMFSKAGTIIEPKIKNYVENQIGIKYLQYDTFAVKFDVFKENKIFGGIPDGEPVNDNNELLYDKNKPMLEIKTTSVDSFVYNFYNNQMICKKDENNKPIVKEKGAKKISWFNNGKIVIPNEYKLQLGLYCYLRGINYGLFAVCFLETEDYVFPKQCDVSKRDIVLEEFFVDLKEFDQIINYAKKWYENHILTGISPKLSKEDINWYNNN